MDSGMAERRQPAFDSSRPHLQRVHEVLAETRAGRTALLKQAGAAAFPGAGLALRSQPGLQPLGIQLEVVGQ